MITSSKRTNSPNYLNSLTITHEVRQSFEIDQRHIEGIFGANFLQSPYSYIFGQQPMDSVTDRIQIIIIIFQNIQLHLLLRILKDDSFLMIPPDLPMTLHDLLLMGGQLRKHLFVFAPGTLQLAHISGHLLAHFIVISGGGKYRYESLEVIFYRYSDICTDFGVGRGYDWFLGLLFFNTKMKVFTLLILFVMLVAVSSKPARPDSLPKTVWTYEATTDNFVHSLCLSRVKAILQESRWVLEILTPSNLFIYLHQHQEFKSAIRNKELSFPQQMQIAKLLILKEYGGLWMDPTTILLDPVDWIQHLKSLEGIENYGSQGYQMVIFSSVSDREEQRSLKGSQEKDGMKMVDANLAMLLALKASPILEAWTKELLKQLKKGATQQAIKDMQSLSLHALSKVLNSDNGKLQDSLKTNKVWKLRYNDFHLNFIQLANSQDPYILADFYIKFPLTTISSQLSQPKYFISLSQVQTQLDEILNPNISKLAYLVHNNQFNLFCPVQVNCAHYVEETSIVYTYLLKDTAFEAQIDDMINKEQRIFNLCDENSFNYLLEYARISIQSTLYLVLLIVCFKIQKICLQLMWVKLKIFGKPKYMILMRILKTVKSVIQYESDNGI